MIFTTDMESVNFMKNNEPILQLECVFTNDSRPRSEYEVKKKIVSELEKLKSDKPGSTNTISIDYAIKIVNKA